MAALSELLSEANAHGWSTGELARRAEKNGHSLAQPTVSKYKGGRHRRPAEAVLTAFSDVLDIQIDELRTAAGVPAGTGSPWTSPSETNRLDTRQRPALKELIRSMVASGTSGEDRTGVERNAERDRAKSNPDTGGMRSWRKHSEAAFAEREDEAPWKRGDFDLAAKRGRNRGRETRELQDAAGEAPDPPAPDDPA